MRILTVSDSPNLCSGLARVHRHVIDALVSQGHEVIPCVWFGYEAETLANIKKGESPPPLFYKSNGKDVRMLCVPKGKAMNCMYAIYDIVAEVKPDVILTIGDFWDFYYMQAIKSKTDFSFRWIAYLTIEQDEIEPKWLPLFRYADALVSPSVFGKQVLEKAVKQHVYLLPYGTEDVFRRLPDDVRLKLRKDRGCENKLRLITVAQNTGRKNLPALAFTARILKDCGQEGIQFYVHTNLGALDPQESCVYDLRAIVARLGVEDWFSFPDDMSVFESGTSDEALRDEYNASDFFVLTSMAEGFGLPLCEAMACGVPAIANTTTTIPEHLGALNGQQSGLASRGFMVMGRTEVFPPSRFSNVCCPEALAEAIMAMAEAEKTGQLEGMRAECEEYAKGRTWALMRDGLAELIGRASGPASLPVEEL